MYVLTTRIQIPFYGLKCVYRYVLILLPDSTESIVFVKHGCDGTKRDISGAID